MLPTWPLGPRHGTGFNAECHARLFRALDGAGHDS